MSEEEKGGIKGEEAAATPENLQELTDLIGTLLNQTQERFQTMSDQIVKRIDEMGKRIDDLESNINDLMTQAPSVVFSASREF